MHDFVTVLHPLPLHASPSSVFSFICSIQHSSSHFLKIPLFIYLFIFKCVLRINSPCVIFPYLISCYPVHASFTIPSISLQSSVLDPFSLFPFIQPFSCLPSSHFMVIPVTSLLASLLSHQICPP